jgi:hypothetical protein
MEGDTGCGGGWCWRDGYFMIAGSFSCHPAQTVHDHGIG